MKVIIAYDGSDYADAAIKDLLRAGLPHRAEAMVISVAEQRLPPPPPSSYEIVEATADAEHGSVGASERASKASEEARALAFQAGKIVQSYFPAWTVLVEARQGDVAGELTKKAEQWGADLIVVGSQGRSALGRLVLGSVSHRVVNEAHCSVRVSRSGYEEKDAAVRIIIGIDGSAGADAAVSEVAARNWPQNTQARLVTSIDPLHIYGLMPNDKYASARGVQQAAEARLSAAGLAVSSVIREENAKQTLINEAEHWKADCIFVGVRGLGRIGRFLLGSVSASVVTGAGCSVEVVRK